MCLYASILRLSVWDKLSVDSQRAPPTVTRAGAWKVRGDEKYLIQRCVSTIQVFVPAEMSFNTCRVFCDKEGRELKQKLLSDTTHDSFAFLPATQSQSLYKEWRFRRKIPFTSGRPETRKKIWIRALFLDVQGNVQKNIRSVPFYACSKPDSNAAYERNDLPVPDNEPQAEKSTDNIPVTSGFGNELRHDSGFSSAPPPKRRATTMSIVHSPSLERVLATPQSTIIYAGSRLPPQSLNDAPAPSVSGSFHQPPSQMHLHPQQQRGDNPNSSGGIGGGKPVPSSSFTLQLPSIQSLSLVPPQHHDNQRHEMHSSFRFGSSSPASSMSATSSSPVSLQYQAAEIHSIYPSSGPKHGGEVTQVCGVFFPELNPQVFFGHLPSRVLEVSKEKLLVKTPSRFLGGQVSVKVVHGIHESPRGAQYFYW